MLNEFRQFLINRGYAVQVNGRPSSVYDSCRGIKFIMKYLNIGIKINKKAKILNFSLFPFLSPSPPAPLK